MESQDELNPIAEAAKRSGLQGLIAAVPVVAWLHGKHTDALTKVLSELTDQQLLGLRQPAAAKAMLQSSYKLAMKEPVVLGATIVAATMGHGAWHGYHRAHHVNRRHREAEEKGSFAEQEDARRARRHAASATRGVDA